MNILVADDDATSRTIVRVALERLGHTCEIVTDGAQAWEAFQRGRPDVVISDWMMPGQTGPELCANIRAHPQGRNIYVILLTSQGAPKQILAGMNAGADNYLIKPLDPDELAFRLVAAARVTSLHRQLSDQRDELETLNHQLATLVGRDPLTGLNNRRTLEEDLETLEARVLRYRHCYCIALLDIDHFKSYNDTYGHQAGDEVLRAVGAELKSQARAGDAVYRYGGEEFLCIFPEQSLASGMDATQRIRAGVQYLNIPHSATSAGTITLSAGVATLDPDAARPADVVLKEADDALYRAKQQGRNRVEMIDKQAGGAGVGSAPNGEQRAAAPVEPGGAGV